MPARRCPRCGEWIEKSLLFCPLCRTPLIRVEPTHHRPAAVFAFAVVLSAAVMVVLIIIRGCVR